MAKPSSFEYRYHVLGEEAKTPYEKRLARGYAQGYTTSQARGHARKSKGELPISEAKKSRPKVQVKTKRFKDGANSRWTLRTYERGTTLNEIADDVNTLAALTRQPEMTGQLIFHVPADSYGPLRVRYSTQVEYSGYAFGLHGDQIDTLAALENAYDELSANYGVRNPIITLNILTYFRRR